MDSPRCEGCADCGMTLVDKYQAFQPIGPHRWAAPYWNINPETGVRRMEKLCFDCRTIAPVKLVSEEAPRPSAREAYDHYVALMTTPDQEEDVTAYFRFPIERRFHQTLTAVLTHLVQLDAGAHHTLASCTDVTVCWAAQSILEAMFNKEGK